ncbi:MULTISPECIES: hypothetical protein [unclassified Thermosynechococcus]|uniref:hypothetical protein n=1 Tax=unclassified Thermosynechococcus TaxID=2622553 RepID=UPI002872CF89|nr:MULTISPECIES: hypothetical protein [unclassified Thermosynechococcus]WNC22069.1 hypothetical protein RHG98_11875 [Thermosynechococcus sp. PP22]WNC32308.1 hypothetical protein RHH81_11830 [Thermosynechococcus sp. PKX95]WNC34837.1 hypothetical protein RHH79_11835 [Thermosynechococcus sp. PKX91]WNC37353.1 hypothetical protein RHI11_11815 [Thermosynechococcus sp. WL11]WNC39875.1 hypothetical protein RHI18_11820 [Thermosynechococcus sp. WL17]
MLKWLRSPLVFLVLLLPPAAYSHAGHGNEFHAPTAGTGPTAVEVDATTQEQLGLRLETVQPRPLAAILEVTGELVALPNQQAVVTMPVRGTLLRLLVQPGDRVRVGQP